MYKIGRKSEKEDTSVAGAPGTPPSGTPETPDTESSKHNSLKHKFSKVGHNFNKMMNSAKPKTPSATAEADDPTPERSVSEDIGVEENEKKSSKFGMMSTANLKQKLNKIAQSTKDKILASDATAPETSDAHISIEADATKGEEEAPEEHKRGSVLTGMTKGLHKIANKVNTKFKQESHDETQHMDISAHSDAAPEAPIDMLEFESSEEAPAHNYAATTPQTEKTHHKSINSAKHWIEHKVFHKRGGESSTVTHHRSTFFDERPIEIEEDYSV